MQFFTQAIILFYAMSILLLPAPSPAGEFDALSNMAEQGHVEAQFKLGDAYYSGKGTRKNLEQAFSWYEKAARQGYARGQFYLGRMFQKGLGVEKDLARALNLYSKAAALGHVQAREQLAK